MFIWLMRNVTNSPFSTAPPQALFPDVGRTCRPACRNVAPMPRGSRTHAVHRQFLWITR